MYIYLKNLKILYTSWIFQCHLCSTIWDWNETSELSTANHLQGVNGVYCRLPCLIWLPEANDWILRLSPWNPVGFSLASILRGEGWADGSKGCRLWAHPYTLNIVQPSPCRPYDYKYIPMNWWSTPHEIAGSTLKIPSLGPGRPWVSGSAIWTSSPLSVLQRPGLLRMIWDDLSFCWQLYIDHLSSSKYLTVGQKTTVATRKKGFVFF